MRIGPVALRVMIPACDADRWRGLIEEPVVLHTFLTLDGQVGGASLEPRLVGFASPDDREVFELLTTVKGIGHRRALRSMLLPPVEIARAIAAADSAALRTLPEVGKKLAETIILELREKMEARVGPQPSAAKSKGAARSASVEPALGPSASAAVAVLVQMGERRAAAAELVRRAAESCCGGAAEGAVGAVGEPTPDALVTAALRLRATAC